MHPRQLLRISWLVLLASNGAANTWYVDLNGAAPGSGTPTDPFTSIQYALVQPTVVSGDVILVAPGVYQELLVFPGKSLTLRSQQGPLVTWIEPNAPGAHVYGVVDLFTTHPNTVEGFTISGAKLGSSNGVVSLASTIRGCILSGNKRNPPGSQFTGSGVTSDYDTWVEGCTVTGNSSGILIKSVAAVYVHNSIVQGNLLQDIDPSTVISISKVMYTLVGGAIPHTGVGNLAGDPLFWDPSYGDYRLRPSSPAIDSGDASFPLDPDGSRCDMGALTYEPSYAPAPTNFCAGKLNSEGCVPAIGAIGSASASSTTAFLVTALHEVPNKSGLLFFGFGARAQPFQGGLHCIALPTKRVGVQISVGAGTCGGTYQFDMGSYIRSGAHPGLIAGALVMSQWWSRDPLDPAGFGTGLSDALRFGIAP